MAKRTITVSFDTIKCIEGPYVNHYTDEEKAAIIAGGDVGPPAMLTALAERGFVVALCCGEDNTDRLIAVYHPDRVEIGKRIECPKCHTVYVVGNDKKFAPRAAKAGHA